MSIALDNSKNMYMSVCEESIHDEVYNVKEMNENGQKWVAGENESNHPSDKDFTVEMDGTDITISNSNATDILKASLLKFFEKRENIDRFLPIINRTSPVSLRLLDYFCVNYSRSTQVVYMIMDKYFDVHSSYKNQLKTFSKKRFDPFRRNTRITFRYDNEKFDTTIGQLCFFKWCLTHNVLDYVEKHIAAISEDMKKNGGKPMDENSYMTEKKRRSSSRKSSMTLAATRVPTAPGTDSVIVTFD